MTDASSAPPADDSRRFGPVEKAIYDRLSGGWPVSITSIYVIVRPGRKDDLPPIREQQQWIGSFLHRLNRKISPKEKIVVGEPRYSYKLQRNVDVDAG